MRIIQSFALAVAFLTGSAIRAQQPVTLTASDGVRVFGTCLDEFWMHSKSKWLAFTVIRTHILF